TRSPACSPWRTICESKDPEERQSDEARGSTVLDWRGLFGRSAAMNKSKLWKFMFLLFPVAAWAATFATAAQKQAEPKTEEELSREVRHQLILLPRYSVFDNLAYSVDGGTVTLVGQVAHASLQSDAEAVVKHIKGVDKVVNNIEVLPASFNDDRI